MATAERSLAGSRGRSSRGRRKYVPPPESMLTLGLTRLTDLALAAQLFLVPACFGGRSPLGQLVFAVGAATTALLWSLRQLTAQTPVWRRLPGRWLWLAGLGIVGLQLAPLPASWLEIISPELTRLLPTWYSGTSDLLPRGWSTASLNPAATASCLATFLSYGVLFWVTAQRIGEREDAEQLLRIVSLSGMAMAVFSLLQYFFSNGQFFWVYQHPTVNTTETALGSFTNRNHLAQFLALAIGPTLWWMARVGANSTAGAHNSFSGDSPTGRAPKLILLTIGLGLLFFAGLLTMSRAGVAALGVAFFLGILLLWRKGQLPAGVLPAMSVIGLVVAGGFLATGYQTLASRIDHLEPDQRPIIWAANVRLAARFPFLGTGAGTHADANPLEVDRINDEREFSHAESGYLQVASECGVPGLAVCLLMILTVFIWWLRAYRSASLPTAAAAAGIGVSLVINLLHAAVDFFWYAPGCMVVVTILAAALSRLADGAPSSAEPVEPAQPSFRLAWVMSIGLLAGLGFWTISQKIPAALAEPYQTAFLRLHYHVGMPVEQDDEIDSEDIFADDILLLKLKSLKAAARANPRDARTQLRLATGYLELFDERKSSSDMPLSLDELRDAIIASNFPSQEEAQQWANEVVGPRRKYLLAAQNHARRAVMNSPLQGTAYLLLAQLSFLRDPTGEQESAWREQALIVRPHDAQVDFAVGQAAFRESDAEIGLVYWKRSFRRSGKYRRPIVGSLAPELPAAELIEEFQPGWSSYPVLLTAYEEAGRDDQLSFLRCAYADAAMAEAEKLSGTAAEHAWMEAVRMYQAEDDLETAAEIAEAALREHSQSHALHVVLGKMLMERHDFAGAAEHLHWASSRSPDDAGLQQMAAEAIKLKLRDERRTAEFEEPRTKQSLR